MDRARESGVRVCLHCCLRTVPPCRNPSSVRLHPSLRRPSFPFPKNLPHPPRLNPPLPPLPANPRATLACSRLRPPAPSPALSPSPVLFLVCGLPSPAAACSVACALSLARALPRLRTPLACALSSPETHAVPRSPAYFVLINPSQGLGCRTLLLLAPRRCNRIQGESALPNHCHVLRSFRMVRRLKYHEKKLVKKANFLEWKREGGHREAKVMRMYHLTGRDDYKKYNTICMMAQKLVDILKKIDARDPFRMEMTDAILEKLYNMGVIPSRKSLVLCEKLAVSAFCRRRLASVLVRLKFAENLKEAVTYIEQGHVRVGPETVTDPAFLVTRNMEDFVTWVDSSKIKRKVLQYNERLDDYDAMN